MTDLALALAAAVRGQGAQAQVMAQHQPGGAEEGPLDRLAPRHRRAAHACDLLVGQGLQEFGARIVWRAHIFTLRCCACLSALNAGRETLRC